MPPQISPTKGLPFHEWFIEFDAPPKDLDQFAFEVDKAMINKNIYYKDLIVGKILRALVIRPVAKGGFKSYMKSIGKLGGQNKVPRVSDNRKIADQLDHKNHEIMKSGRVTLVCNVKNTFVMKDVELLESMGYYVYLIHSPPYQRPSSFFV